MNIIIVKHKAIKALNRLHPWIFSGAVQKVYGSPAPGDTVEIRSSQDKLLGFGAFSPHSQIRVRIWTFNPGETICPDFFKSRIAEAILARKLLIHNDRDTAVRLINAESDGLPGLIVDQYGGFLVCQFLSAGAEFWKRNIVGILKDLVPCTGIYERSDTDVRKKEGLLKQTGILWGTCPPDLVEISENNVKFYVDIITGHKTGFYLDQKGNRAYAAGYAKDKTVLNCFSYTGGFGIAAMMGGAKHVTQIDASGPALELALKNARLNGLAPGGMTHEEGNVFSMLRLYRDESRQFDMVILDPPKFAESKNKLKKAARGYKDINLLALKLIRPGGILFTFSCSGLLSRDLFQKIVSDAALDAHRNVRVLQWLSQSPDHHAALNFPEGFYLKGLICRVM